MLGARLNLDRQAALVLLGLIYRLEAMDMVLGKYEAAKTVQMRDDLELFLSIGGHGGTFKASIPGRKRLAASEARMGGRGGQLRSGDGGPGGGPSD